MGRLGRPARARKRKRRKAGPARVLALGLYREQYSLLIFKTFSKLQTYLNLNQIQTSHDF
jgi:hypothetical protein